MLTHSRRIYAFMHLTDIYWILAVVALCHIIHCPLAARVVFKKSKSFELFACLKPFSDSHNKMKDRLQVPPWLGLPAFLNSFLTIVRFPLGVSTMLTFFLWLTLSCHSSSSSDFIFWEKTSDHLITGTLLLAPTCLHHVNHWFSSWHIKLFCLFICLLSDPFTRM